MEEPLTLLNFCTKRKKISVDLGRCFCYELFSHFERLAHQFSPVAQSVERVAVEARTDG